MTTLPTGHMVTLGANSEIPSALLDALQDCIIGAKHPSLVIELSAGDWRVEGSSASYTVGFGKWTWSGFDDLTIGLRIPVGTRITAATFHYNRTGGTINAKIQKAAVGAGAWTTIASASDGVTAGAGSLTLAATEVVVSNTQYRLYIDASGVTTFDVASYTIDRL